MMRFSANLESVVKQKIIKYSVGSPVKNLKILIAYSGGVDSSVLLHIIDKLSYCMKFSYDFVYINHEMRLDNINILKYSKQFALNSNASFIYDVVQKKYNSNKEALYRQERYDCFNRLREKNNYNMIFTAHHYNDQLETVFMRNKRSSSDWTNSLGIHESINEVKRPFLYINKKEILDYAVSNNINWFFDHTNNDSRIQRNHIRNNLIPNLKLLDHYKLQWEHFVAKMKLSIFKLNLKKNKKIILKQSDSYTLIDKCSFLKLEENYRKLFLQYLVREYNDYQYLKAKHTKWNALWDYLSKNKNLKDFRLSSLVVINNSKNLIILRKCRSYNRKIIINDNAVWNEHVFRVTPSNIENDKLSDKNIAYIPQEIFEKGIFARNWSKGDYYLSKGCRKKVSKIFIKNKFNNYNKMYYPLIVNSFNEIIWIPGLTSMREASLDLNNNYIKVSKEILN